MDKKIEHPFNYMCQAPLCPPNFNVDENMALAILGVRFLLYSRWVCQKLLQR